MLNIRQFHIRRNDEITGVLRTSAPLELPLSVYLSKVNMTAFLRSYKPGRHGKSGMFKGTAVFGRHPSAQIESDANGYVDAELIPYIQVKEGIDVKT